MEFREHVTTEVSALVEGLARAAAAQTAAALQCAHDEHAEHDAAAAALRGRLEEANAYADAALQRAQNEHDATVAALWRQLEEVTTRADASDADLRRALDEHRVEHVEHDAALASLRGQLEEAIAQANTALRRAEYEHHAALTAFQGRLEEATRETGDVTAALESARAQLGGLRAERQAAPPEQAEPQRASADPSSELEELRARLETAEAQVERGARQFEVALEDLRLEHVNTLQEQALERTALPIDELIAVFSALGTATTPGTLLAALVDGLAREFSRVALFRLRGNRLEGVHHVGFDAEGDITKIVIPTSVDSLLTRSVQSGRIESFLAGPDTAPCSAPFGGTPACALALPLVARDGSLAVIYVDDSDQMEFAAVPTPLLVKFAELVWRHAVLVLQRFSMAQQVMPAPPSHAVNGRN